MITTDHKSKVDKIWETFWNNGISNTIVIVEQLTYLIFIKNLDEIETRNELKARRGFEIKSIFGTKQQQFRWKNLKEMSVDERHQLFIDNKDGIFPFIRNLGAEKSMFATHMRNASFGITKPQLLDSVMDQLETIDMNNQDAKGDIYEYMLSKMEGGGTSGQFRTPRHIIKLMVALMEPSLEDSICDPSAGTAGFLVAAKEYIDQHYSFTEIDDHREYLDKKMFNGMEFDSTMLRIASMNLYLHGVQEPNIYDVDALSKDNSVADAYSLILANPPFKGKIDKETISPSLKNITNTTKTELLFLALMLRQLKTGGRAAVIVPDGVLFGSSNAHKGIRKEIIDNHKLEAVISMPSGVFKPYAGVSTAIMIFTKTNSGGTDYVWFYDMKADGKSLDDKRNLLVDEELFDAFSQSKGDFSAKKLEQMAQAHENFNLPQILDHYRYLKSDYWGKMHTKEGDVLQVQDTPDNLGFDKFMENTYTHNYSDRTSQSFLVPLREITENDWDLSINRYKEIVYEEVEYDKPEVILERILKLGEERNALIQKLR
ncbi:type I restriction enzyme M protein [Salegentibacter echinorum]|uniref:site-specific DNA-methyltransferase (adenine-specific) n=1 Tax=Salegentibacter echinorum TaxID=1073325 RepID=A0A1M5DLL2_SALEC|nr:class I SAM-dependent DNA methyltransferase [Salegentibacter echinorum]SHF67867.1 type I restriction enzyme M protein [Salegentibacter echinorum]